MRSYTVHRRRRTIGQPLAEAEATVLVGDGFAWLAFVVPMLWALYHRMWIVLTILVAVMIAANAALASLEAPPLLAALVNVAICFLFASDARDLRRWTLARKGYDIVAVVLARSSGEAEAAYFRRWHKSVNEHYREHEVGDGVEIAFRTRNDRPAGKPAAAPAEAQAEAPADEAANTQADEPAVGLVADSKPA